MGRAMIERAVDDDVRRPAAALAVNANARPCADGARFDICAGGVGCAELPAMMFQRDAVTGGDLAKAAEEYDALPDRAKAAGADFMAGLQARLKVDALAQKALASALKTG